MTKNNKLTKKVTERDISDRDVHIQWISGKI